MIKNFLVTCKTADKNFIKHFISLNIIYVINSFVQLAYVLSVIPIISFVTATEMQISSKFSNQILKIGNFFFDNDFLIFSIFFIFISLFANGFMIIINFLNFSFTQNLQSNLRKKIFFTYMNSDYLFINSNNLSFYNIIIFQQVDRLVNNVVGSINLILQNSFTTLIIILTIFFIIKLEALIIFGIVVAIFSLFVFLFKKYFSKTGSKLNFLMKERQNILNKLILNFKEIQIFGIKNFIFSQYSSYEDSYNRNIKYSSFFNHSLKPFIEILAVICFAILVFINIENFQKKDFFIKLSVIVFALYKILPSINVIYSAFNQIIYDKSSIKIIHDQIVEKKEINLLDNTNNKEKIFEEKVKTLKIEDLEFNFGGESLINNFSYEFFSGNIYLIKGDSGKGKSTFLNLLMGLIKFNRGNIYYNNKKFDNFNNYSWFNIISFVPQKMTLLNNNLKDNITFSFNDNYDKKKYLEVLKNLNIYDEFFDRKNEIINEYTSNLSGGQAQRIGLARALYRNSQVIFLDEPTSNLDEMNEIKFLNLVAGLKKDKIIIIISHKKHENIKFDDIINFN